MQQLSLSLLEIIVLMAGAITLGITIHFFIVSRRNLNDYSLTPDRNVKTLEEWKLRYFNDVEKKDQEIAMLRKELEHLNDQQRLTKEETEELKFKLRKAEQPAHHIQHTTTDAKADYLEQLRSTQRGLLEQNQRIAELLEQIDLVRENEGLKGNLRQENEELTLIVEDMRERLDVKEKELESMRKQSQVSTEMSSMLDNAYRDFNALQEKILKLETQVSNSKRISMEYEDLREGFFKASRDLEDQRNRLNQVLNENKDLQLDLSETGDKLREANFQRQQLQKRVAYLEELNEDLQTVADANRKLENQLKRIGELESLLNVMAEERDELARKQMNTSSL